MSVAHIPASLAGQREGEDERAREDRIARLLDDPEQLKNLRRQRAERKGARRREERRHKGRYQMEHHADAGLARAPATVGAAPGCLGHQACALQGGLGPGVAPGEAMVGAEMVVEVLDRPARMAGSVLLEHPFDPVGRHAARGRLVEPSIEQSVQARRGMSM